MKSKIISLLGYLSVAAIALSIAVFTVTGDVQRFIKFADPLNEMAFAFIFFMLGAAFGIAAFTNDDRSRA
jgi:hypothetical protein